MLIVRRFLREGAYKASRVAHIYAWFCNILCHHSARAHYGIVADADRQNRCVRANGYIGTDVGGRPQGFVATGWPTDTEQIIDEHGAMGDETIIANCYKLANKRVGLYPAVFAYFHVFLNLHERADKGILAYFTSIKIDRLNNGDAGAKAYIFANTDAFKGGLVVHRKKAAAKWARQPRY